MTERTVRSMAKELAGTFYEEPQRSPGFRKAFPTFRHYMQGRQVMADGSVQQIVPGWQHHLALARKMLAIMLGKPDAVVHPNVKEAIFNALIEDRDNQYRATKQQKKSIAQVGVKIDA